MGEGFRLDYVDSVPTANNIKSQGKYHLTLQRFVKADKPCAMVKGTGTLKQQTLVTAFKKAIKEGNYPVECVRRGDDVYLIRSKGQKAR